MGEIETPTRKQDETITDDSDSDVSIEPYMAEWKDYEIIDMYLPALVPEEMGNPLICWHGRRESWKNNPLLC